MGRLKPVGLSLSLIATALIALTACAATPATPGPGSVDPLWMQSDRGIKSELVEHLATPPAVVVLGGSRALRFQPTFIREKTGLCAFNAAVPHATPEDEWCYVNLIHQRFPQAHFDFLWVIHVDEFDEFAPGPGLLEDPLVSRFLPPDFVSERLDELGARVDETLVRDAQTRKIIAPDGFMVSDGISAAAAHGSLAQRVARIARATRQYYAHTPPVLGSVPCWYFARTLDLMDQMGARTTIVLAPVQPWYLAAVREHGWSVRHGLVLAYLRALSARYPFRVLDFSRLSSIGGSPAGFYDGVHLRPSTTRRVVDAIVRLAPQALAPPGGSSF